MRPRLHTSNADKQRAYRARQRQREAPPMAAQSESPVVKEERRPTRPARIAGLVNAIDELAHEYRTWREAIPPNLASGPLAEQLDETIGRLEGALELLAEIEPPRIGR